MRRATVPILLIAGLVVSAPASAPAFVRQAPTGELRRLQDEYRDEAARARKLRADADRARRELSELERRLATLRVEKSDDDTQIQAQRQRLKSLSDREAALVSDLARERGAQSRLLSALQMMTRKPPPPLLIPADKAVDTVRAAILMRSMTPELERRAQALGEKQAEILRVRRLAVLSSEDLLTRETAQGDRRAEIESLTSRKSALTAVLSAEARVAERGAKALEARIRALGGAVPTTQAPEPETADMPAGRSQLTPPVDGAPVETFGSRSTGWRWSVNAGVVQAPADAKVAYAGPLQGWGQVIILDMGPGWRAVIAGLEQIEVDADDRVTDGQSLGRSGPDGDVYFELRREERPIDPAPWLR